MRTPLLFVATVALLLSSAAAQAQSVGIQNPDQSTPTILYMHLINVQDMPINTQLPDPSFADSGEFGPGTHTLSCLHPTTGQATQGSTSQVYHTFYGYSSPSYVEYDYETASGDPRTHPERGISYDALFDKSTPFTLYWYVATYNAGQPGDSAPTPTPAISVAATMRGGTAISVDDKAYNTGETLAAGQTDPAILLPGDFQGAPGPGPQAFPGPGEHTQVTYAGSVQADGGTKHIYQFAVPMQYEKDMVTRAQGFNIRIDMFVDNDFCNARAEDQQYFMTNTVSIYSDAEHRPRMDFAITNPIRLEYLHPQFVGDDLVVHTSMNSAWGNYDVDETSPDGITVSIEGPSPATSLEKAALVQRFHEHYHHQEAVDVTYVWPYKADRASNGVYTVLVSFKNDQGTAEATGTAQFEIGKGTVIGCGGIQESTQELSEECVPTVNVDGKTQTEEAPGVPLLAVLGAFAAIAAVLRRRQA